MDEPAAIEPPRLAERLSARALPGDPHVYIDEALIEGDGEPVGAASLEIAASRLSGLSFAAGHMRPVDVHDSVLDDCDLSNVHMQRCSMRRTELRTCRLIGAAAPDGDLQDVRVTNGSLMLATFSDMRLTRVVFDGVNLREASFSGAQLDRVSFLGCELAGADFRGARLRGCWMSGSELGDIVGVQSLRGLTMPWADLVASAGALAAAIGIEAASSIER